MVAKHPIQEFGGRTFYRKPPGYYKTDYAQFGTCYMHRYVWECTHGPIPPGFDVHHVDRNRANNAISNLELLPTAEHHRLHMREHEAAHPGWWKPGLEKAREAAKAWHASPEGLEWHRQHGRAVAAAAPAPVESVCTHCGGTYLSHANRRKRGFCSPSCQGMARKASGVDDETRTCVTCGGEFRTNKHVGTKTCSKDCWKAAIVATRRLRAGSD